MSQSTFSIRMDESLKKQFDMLCHEFGMNANTAMNIFARAVVRERKIPFEISSANTDVTRKGAVLAFNELRSQSVINGANSMTLDEINEEISNSRKEEAR